jgi:hypothetical protein
MSGHQSGPEVEIGDLVIERLPQRPVPNVELLIELRVGEAAAKLQQLRRGPTVVLQQPVEQIHLPSSVTRRISKQSGRSHRSGRGGPVRAGRGTKQDPGDFGDRLSAGRPAATANPCVRVAPTAASPFEGWGGRPAQRQEFVL